MFRISKAEEQALRLTMRLASVGTQQTLGDLAVAERLPEPTVAKLLGQLKRGGVVDAVRGRHGGYILADQPSNINAARILQCVITRPAFGYPCKDADRATDCTRSRDCGLRPVWRMLEKRVNGVLEQTSIADMLLKESDMVDQIQMSWPAGGE